jgi:transcriptional regulator with XRE-family HTH domain
MKNSQPKDQAMDASQEKAVKDSQNKVPKKQPSILRQLREQRNLSQRELARKMGVSRIQLQWMENKHPERLLLREVKLMAGALQYSLPALMKIMGFEGELDPKFFRCSLDQPVSNIRFDDGVELASILEQGGKAFAGRLSLLPQKSFSLKQLPGRVDYVFAKVMQGMAFVEGCGSPMILKEKEGLFIDSGAQLNKIEMQNNHSVQKLSVLFFAHLLIAEN